MMVLSFVFGIWFVLAIARLVSLIGENYGEVLTIDKVLMFPIIAVLYTVSFTLTLFTVLKTLVFGEKA